MVQRLVLVHIRDMHRVQDNLIPEGVVTRFTIPRGRPLHRSPDLDNLLSDKQIACVDSPHPASLLRDLNSSCPFSSAIHNTSQTHDTP